MGIESIPITPGSGRLCAVDQVVEGAETLDVQVVKLLAGSDGVNGGIVPADSARGLSVDPRLKVVRLSQTPAISTAVYAAKDAVGGLLTFAGAARAVGGSCRIEAVQIVDKGQQRAQLDLVLFDRAFTAPTDNAIFAPTDAELSNVVAVVPIFGGDYADFSTNSVAHKVAGVEILLNGTDLFGALVTRGTPTYTSTADLVVTLTLAQE